MINSSKPVVIFITKPQPGWGWGGGGGGGVLFVEIGNNFESLAIFMGSSTMSVQESSEFFFLLGSLKVHFHSFILTLK